MNLSEDVNMVSELLYGEMGLTTALPGSQDSCED